MLTRHASLWATGLVAIATLRIASTYMVFNHTQDEPAHLACGLEWIGKGTYNVETQHPPLARVMIAALPYAMGARLQNPPPPIGILEHGRAVMDSSPPDAYFPRLAAARAGVLPFFWLACAVVWWWARRLAGSAAGLAALAVFTNTPTVLAHAGLATTDMALTAGLAAALYGFLVWWDDPSWQRTLLLGAAGAVAVTSKFSALAYFPVCLAAFAAVCVVRKRASMAGVSRRALLALVALGIAAFGLAAMYRFSMFFEIYHGIETVRMHNVAGHMSFLLGKTSQFGFWYYYPVALAFKAPLPLLLLALAGAVVTMRATDPREWAPVVFTGAMLAFAGWTSQINIGVRHVLPVFVFAAVAGGVAVVRLPRVAAKGLVGALVLVSIAAHPDYIPYMNFLAGEPENVLTDSDFDWGQDIVRAGRRLNELGVKDLAFRSFVSVPHLPERGFPRSVAHDPLRPRPGWNLVSSTELKVARMGLRPDHPGTPWPDIYEPTERIGGMLLYYAPADTSTMRKRASAR